MQKLQEVLELLSTLTDETTEHLCEIQQQIENEPISSNNTDNLWKKHDQLDTEQNLLIKLKLQILESVEKQIMDPYQKRLIKWFGPDLDLKHKTREICRKNQHALFVVWHNNELQLMKIVPSVNTEDNNRLIISQQACFPCYTYDEFDKGKTIAATVADQISKL